MPTWRSDYVVALRARSKKENANSELIGAYTRLADRSARTRSIYTSLRPRNTSALEDTPVKVAKGEQVFESGKDLGGLATIRSDLSEAQRSKAELERQLSVALGHVDRYTIRAKADSQRLNELLSERVTFVTKMRDREEELRGKAKLLEEVQDEQILLNLQLEMAEQRAQRLQDENKELVDRWMALKRDEADAMNNASNFS